MLGGADNPNGELPSYITGADSVALTGRNQRIRLLSFLTTLYGVPPQDMFYSVLLYQIVWPYYATPGEPGAPVMRIVG